MAIWCSFSPWVGSIRLCGVGMGSGVTSFPLVFGRGEGRRFLGAEVICFFPAAWEERFPLVGSEDV
jgi:hypothetical protein